MKAAACAVAAVFAAALGTMATVARAGGSRDLVDTWLVPLEALTAAGGAAPASWHATVAAGRLYGLPDLMQWRLAGSLERQSWRAGAAWERLGGSLLREDGARAHAAIGRRLTLGFEAGVDQLALLGSAPRVWPAAAVRVGGQIAPGLRGEVWLHLRESPPWYGTAGLRRVAVVEAACAGWAWALAADRATDGRPALQGEVMAQVGAGACLGLRVDPWSGSLGLSTAWRVRVGWLRTSHLVHPDLGTSHRWALVLGPRTGERP